MYIILVFQVGSRSSRWQGGKVGNTGEIRYIDVGIKEIKKYISTPYPKLATLNY